MTSPADSIPELPRTERTVEELVRLVQECGDVIQRRDTTTIMRAVADVQDMAKQYEHRPPNSKEAIRAMRQHMRPLLLVYMLGDEAEAAGAYDGLGELEDLETRTAAPLPSVEAMPSGIPQRLMEQLREACQNALSAADGMTASAKKYREKAETEKNGTREIVYRRLQNSCASVAEHHLAIGRELTDTLGTIVLACKTVRT